MACPGGIELFFVDLSVSVGVCLIEVLLDFIIDGRWDFDAVSSSIIVSTIEKFLEGDVTISGD
jgi:hypothetical protein